MLARLLRSAGIAALLAASAALVAPSALAQKDPQATIAASETSLSNFLRDLDMIGCREFGRAKAVMISPEIVKAGFIFGGSARGCMQGPKSGKVRPVFARSRPPASASRRHSCRKA